VRVLLLILFAAAVHVGLGLLTHHHHELGVDRAAFDLIKPLRGATGLHVVRVLTEIGSYPVAALVGVAGATYAAVQRRPHEVLAIALGLVAVILLVGATKHGWDRPRPVGRYYDPLGHSYPSGHSAYAIIWISAAILTGRRALIVAAVLVAVTIGASRLYLHVHYLTDVLGGYALGAAVFAPVLARTMR
jgi:membrane-associated phospholipid phosphatase